MKKLISHKMAIFIVGAHTFSYLALLFLFNKNDWILTVGSNLFQTTAPLISAFWLYRRYTTESSKSRNFWLFLCMAIGSYAIGMFCWMYYEIYLRVTPPFPGLPDAFWILMNLLLFIAFNYLILKSKTSSVFQLIYDTFIVITVASSVSWAFIIKPILEDSVEQGMFYKIVYAGYPISDLALLFGLLCIFNSRNFKLSSKLLFLNLLGISIFLVYDTVYLYLVSQHQYVSSNPIEVLWNLGIFFIGITSFYSNENIMETNKTSNNKINQVNYFFEIRLWLPYLSVFSLFILMINENKEINGIIVGSVTSISLIIFRQIFTLFQNQKLLGKSKILNKELERQVQRRTKQLIEKNLELEKSISKVEYLAYHDTLTALPNRRYFEKYLKKFLQDPKNKRAKASVLFLDLDRFKVINDTLGHSIGDRLLQQVAKRLNGCIENKGLVCRQGGDEFIVLLLDAGKKDAILLAERILESLGNRFIIEGHELFISTSIGISLFPNHGEEVEKLIKRADVAMYAVKNYGKNSYKIFTTELNETFVKRLTIENGLRKAIDQEGFLLYYQPKLELNSNKIVGMEALIRWNHSEMGWIPPGTFIPIAEESGLINKLGNWVIHTACQQTKRWQEEGLLNLCVSVNVSAIQFAQKDLFEQIEKALVETGLEPKYLELEVTESIMQNVHEVSSVLLKLKELGVKISLDDFGSGFSSLTKIKHLPIDILKIDKSFIDDLVHSSRDQAIVKTIIELGKNLELLVIAEGVEYEEQVQYLQKNGCDQIQGYIISQPLPPEEFERIIRSNLIYI